jgi:hypothetical protein
MLDKARSSQATSVPSTMSSDWFVTVYGKSVRVPASQLLISSGMRERMKELALQHEVSYFPESVWSEDPSQHVVVDCVLGGKLRVVNSDPNLLRLMRWTNPMGLNAPTIPVWIAGESTSRTH